MTPTLSLPIFFTILLISSAQNLRKTPVFQDPITILNELDNKHFGNALISTIAVHLSANSPIENIVNLLNNLKESLEKDQENSRILNITDQRECEKMISDFSNNVIYHEKQLKSEEELKEKSEIFLQKSQQNYQQIISDLSRNTDHYEENEALRSKQHANFLQKSIDYEEALSALDEANSLLEHLKSGSALIQMKKKLEKVKEKLAKHHLLHNSLYNILISSLADIAINADQDSVKKIIVLLSELHENLADSKGLFEKNEKQQEIDWEKVKNTLQNEKKHLISRKSESEEELESEKRAIQDTEGKIADHTMELESNRALYENAKIFCERKAKEYQRTSEEIQAEVEILERLFVNFNEKLGNLKEYLKNRVNFDF